VADQAIIYACLLSGKSEFTVTELTSHFLTNVWVIQQFLPARIAIEGEKGTPGKVTVKPGGNLIRA
jgi:RNA 3'-terminal phosphate cyclase (GTP)